jgi:hypothetical protein
VLQPGLVLIKRALTMEQQKWLVGECFRYAASQELCSQGRVEPAFTAFTADGVKAAWQVKAVLRAGRSYSFVVHLRLSLCVVSLYCRADGKLSVVPAGALLVPVSEWACWPVWGKSPKFLRPDLLPAKQFYCRPRPAAQLLLSR